MTEFAGMVHHEISQHKKSEINMNYLFDKQKDNLLTLLIGQNREMAKRDFYYNSKHIFHMNEIFNTNIRRLNLHKKTTFFMDWSLEERHEE